LKLLLVEDDAELVEELRGELNAAGYAVETALDGIDGEFLGQEEDFDAVILDLGLPGRPGLGVLANWRRAGRDFPVLILTARDAWHERVDGLRAGADDYLGKPFHTAELLARLEALIRRRAGRADSALQWQGVILDTERHQATTAEGTTIPLTGIEFRLLRYLMLHPSEVHSKISLSEHIYEEENLKDSNVIEVYINRLRRYFGREFIHTLRGQGYRLAAPARQPDPGRGTA
jgi:two-component system OmpR family response regulator